MAPLTTSQVEFYQQNGFLSPLTAIASGKALQYRRNLEAFEASLGRPIGRPFAYKPHLIMPWVEELARTPHILDAVQSIIGPNILLFHITCWPKPGNDASFVSWHQDSTMFGLMPDDQHITAWVALSESAPKSGCVQVLPGSHKVGQVNHVSETKTGNMLGWGQTVKHDTQSVPAFNLTLQPGEFSLHHTHLLHNSPPNFSSDRRIGIGLSYIPTHVRCTSQARLTAMLMRGVDDYNFYDHEPSARAERDPEAMAFHADAVARFVDANNEQAQRFGIAN